MQSLNFPPAALGAASLSSPADSVLCEPATATPSGSFDQFIEQALGGLSEQNPEDSEPSMEASSQQTGETETGLNPPSTAAAEFIASFILSMSEQSAQPVAPLNSNTTGSDALQTCVQTEGTSPSSSAESPELWTTSQSAGTLISSAAKESGVEFMDQSTGKPASLEAAIATVTPDTDSAAGSEQTPSRTDNTAAPASRNLGSEATIEPNAAVDAKLVPTDSSRPENPANSAAIEPASNFPETMTITPSQLENSSETADPTALSDAVVDSEQPMTAEQSQAVVDVRNRRIPRGENNWNPEGKSASEIRGTSGAKYPSPMQKAEKMKDSAGLAEQKLPVTETSTATPFVDRGSVRDLPSGLRADKSDSAANQNPSFPAVASTTETHTTAAPLAVSVPVRSIERAHDLIALHSFRLRDLGNDTMEVVIKPDPNLHLALSIQMRDGAIEVNVQLQKGDYELLNRHWTELQQQLESRGVRLAPLSQPESTASNSNNSNSNLSQNPRRETPDEKPARAGAFAEFALSNVLVPKRTNKVTGPRGWESWA